MDEIKITSLVDCQTGKALVRIDWGPQSGQLTAAEARAHALRVLEAAEAAETDLFLVTWAPEVVGLKMEQAVTLLRDFRKRRDDQSEETAG